MARLVEILAKELAEWPKGLHAYAQDQCGSAYPWTGDPDFDDGDWIVNNDAGVSNVGPVLHKDQASDYSTSIVTKDQWQAERDKQNGGEWKRHRGNKQPIEGGLYIEAKLRCGDIQRGYAQDFIWPHAACDVEVNLMKYRVISQPQAEEVEVNKFCAGEKCSATAENIVHSQQCQLEHEIAYTGFKIDQIDGPIKWRDTVNELDAYIEEFTREREALINRLALEGFALIPAAGSVAVVAGDPTDWRNWKTGDTVKCTESDCANVYTVGRYYNVIDVTRDYAKVEDDCGPGSHCNIDDDDVGVWFTRI